MDRHFAPRVVRATLRLAILMMFGFAWVLPLFPAEIAIAAEISPSTPPPGNPGRKAVLDALRQEILKLNSVQVVFVVEELRMCNGWTWIKARPQSTDGMNTYEEVFALLQFRDGGWEIAEIPCTELENPDCIDAPDFFKKLTTRFPEMPRQILPLSTGQNSPD